MPESADLSRLREENQRLHRAVEELSVLNEIALAINSTMSPEQVNQLIVGKCVKRLGVQQGTIHLFGTTESDPTKTLVRVMQPGQDGLPMRLGIQLTGWMHKNRRPLVINDLAKDERFGGADTKNLAIKSLLSVPLELKGRLIGILNLFNKDSGDITSEDARLAAIIASQCAQVIENARLYAEEVKLHALEEDLSNATRIQQMLLPRTPPVIPGVDLAGLSHPARDVGGDYFDYIDLGADRWGIAVGDVSGKGMPAALLMANLQATMRGCARTAPTVAACVEAANRLLLASTDAKTFVTLFYAVYNSRTKSLAYCNAGHNPPYRQRPDGVFQKLETGGPLAAAFGWSKYEEETIQFASGDRLLIYTDGVTEAANP
ncbi:MAG: SpoIIE family protein phosphatase, partial [candidate division Zixibacteria bacterium]|nr:SpoIIE family protein phosphatase [candidate division Zixibacteria bacterium]